MVVSTNRIAVVTGANKGIGFHIALQLAASKCFEHVILGCRDQGRGEAAVTDIRQRLITSGIGTSVSSIPLELGNTESHFKFGQLLQENFGSDYNIDVLVNNAAMAFKAADPTPFEKQTKPTLDINFRATVDFTENVMLPLMRQSSAKVPERDVRIINVASMAGRLGQLKSRQLQEKITDSKLTMKELKEVINEFERSVRDGTFREKGFGSSNYGMSKLSLIAATKIWARDLASEGVKVNCCCPGYCATDMSSHKGHRSASDGAKNAVILATMPQDECPTGAFYQNMEPSAW